MSISQFCGYLPIIYLKKEVKMPSSVWVLCSVAVLLFVLVCLLHIFKCRLDFMAGSLVWVHIDCNYGYLRKLADERADKPCHEQGRSLSQTQILNYLPWSKIIRYSVGTSQADAG